MKYQPKLIWKCGLCLVLALLSACSSVPPAHLDELAWAGATILGDNGSNEYADQITVSPNGFTFVAGHNDTATLFLAKLNGSGVKLWIKYFGGNGSRIEKITADAVGNSFIVTRRTVFQVGLEPGQFIFTLSKFAPNGNLLWQKDIGTINSPDISVAYAFVSALEFDALGTLFVPIGVHDVGRAGPLPPQIEYGLFATFDPDTGNVTSSFRWDNNYPGQSRKIIDARVRQQPGVAGEWLILEQFAFASALERRTASGVLLAEQIYGGVPLKIASVTAATEPFAIFMTDVYYSYTCIAIPDCKVTFAKYLDNSVINPARNEVAIIRRDATQKLHGERYRITGTSVIKVNTYPEPVPFALDKLALNSNSAILSAGSYWNGSDTDIQVRKFNARGVQF